MPNDQSPRTVPEARPGSAVSVAGRASRGGASDFDPEVWRLFDAYVHGLIDRRAFLERAARFAAHGLTAAALLDALNPRFAEARQVAPDDPRLIAEYVELASPGGYGKVRAYQVRPSRGARKPPAVLVVHENRGLNPHIEDIARGLALAGFLAFAPDALTPLGGYPGEEDAARALFQKLDQEKTRADFIAAAKHLQQTPRANGKVGVVGFCYGGGMALYLATQIPTLDAAVAFYGLPPPPESAPAIKTPLQVHLAETDDRINTAWPRFEEALRAAQTPYQLHRYPGTQHGFNNDTTPRYDASAAKLAWDRTLAFFKQHLDTTPARRSRSPR